jgi:signal peptidase I
MNPEERKQILSGKRVKRNRTPVKGKKGSEKGKEGEEVRDLTWQEQTVSWIKTILGALIIVMIANGLLIQSFVVPTESMENEVMAGDFVFVNRFVYGGSTPQTIPFLNIPLPYIRFPGIRDPERRDVIVFIYPGDRDQVEPDAFEYYLKRCIGVAGDVVEVRNGIAYINGEQEILPENVILPPSIYNPQEVAATNVSSAQSTFPRGAGFRRDDWGPMRIPKGGDVIELKTPEDVIMWRVFIQREGHEAGLDGHIPTIDGKAVDSYTVKRDYVFGMGDNRLNSEDSRYWGFIPVENVVGTPLIVYWSWENRKQVMTPRGPATAEKSFGEKLGSIRWNRVFNGID